MIKHGPQPYVAPVPVRFTLRPLTWALWIAAPHVGQMRGICSIWVPRGGRVVQPGVVEVLS